MQLIIVFDLICSASKHCQHQTDLIALTVTYTQQAPKLQLPDPIVSASATSSQVALHLWGFPGLMTSTGTDVCLLWESTQLVL